MKDNPRFQRTGDFQGEDLYPPNSSQPITPICPTHSRGFLCITELVTCSQENVTLYPFYWCNTSQDALITRTAYGAFRIFISYLYRCFVSALSRHVAECHVFSCFLQLKYGATSSGLEAVSYLQSCVVANTLTLEEVVIV